MCRRILVVDDDEHIVEVAAATLASLRGWDVITASGGRQAIARAIADQPDAILLDLMMPDMDGATALAELHADPLTAHIPVVLLTAYVELAGRRHPGGLEVQAVIAKPFDPVALPKQVADALGWVG